MTTWIIMPAYQAAEFVVTALASLTAQSVADWRAVVVDDGSTDSTADLVREVAATEPRVVLVQRPNGGTAAARNTGLRVALADEACREVLFLDSDDALLPGALATLRAALVNDPAAVAAIGLAKYIDREGHDLRPGAGEDWGRARRVPMGRLGIRTLDLREPTTFESLVCVHGVSTPGVVLYRRTVVDDVGEVSEAFPVAADWDYHVRVARRGHLAFVDSTVTAYRSHGANLSKSPKMAADTDGVWHVAWASPENTDAQRVAVVRGYRALQVHMAKAKGPNVLAWLRRGRLVDAAREVAYGLKHVIRALRRHP